jgi:hypothetical protein
MTAIRTSAAQAYAPIGRRSAALLLMLATAVVVSACGYTEISSERAFDAKSENAIVIVAARPDVGRALVNDINTKNSQKIIYSLLWRKYDPDTDIAAPMTGPDFFGVQIGKLALDTYSCPLIDGWTYCIHEIEPGHYVMAASSVSQNKLSGLFSLERTSLGVGKNFLGGLEVNDDVPVSESGAQRLQLEAGKIYYLGEYLLSEYAQVVSRESHPERARHLLNEFPNMKGDLVEPDYIGDYRLQLRTGFCALQKYVSPMEFTTGNVC